MDSVLRDIMEGLANRSGKDYFDQIVLHLQRVTGADYILIARLNADMQRCTTLAFCKAGSLQESVEYRLQGTPYAKTISDKYCSYAKDVAKQFPADEQLQRLAIQGYTGTALIGANGNPLGVIAGLHCQPIDDDDALDLFRIFSGRIAVEIERAEQQQLLEEYNETLEASVAARTNKLKQALDSLKTTQVQMVQQEKMASIGQLAAGVAHEINNPIGFIKSNLCSMNGYTKSLLQLIEKISQHPDPHLQSIVTPLLQDSDFEYLRQDLPDLVSESLDGVERVSKIIQSLKSFSRIDDNETREPANIETALENSIAIVWNELKYKTQLERHYSPLPLVVCAVNRISQVLVNLLVNAAQAIPDKGIIQISTRHAGNEVQITISDNGCGIPADKLKRIFDPFFTTKPVGKGTGLGLSVSAGIIQDHKGRIEVQSVEGEGTSFTVHLPVGEE